MTRFFKKLEEGIFDEEDLIFRTKELNEFLDEAALEYGFNRDDIFAIGYSNGANIVAGTNDQILFPEEPLELQQLLEKLMQKLNFIGKIRVIN